MSIHLLHGTVDDWSADRRIHRLYVPATRLRAYLQARETPYQELTTENQRGDVLTVDDSTNAGAAACLMARELGHEVTFFVNPHQIITGRPYFFSSLDICIDNRLPSIVSYADAKFDLNVDSETNRFRLAARSRLMRMADSDIGDEIAAVVRITKASSSSIPHFATPISEQALIDLHKAGVKIQNHGWSHIEIDALTDDQFSCDFDRTQYWIRHRLGVSPTAYAVPFGLTRLTLDRQRCAKSLCLLVTRKLPLGRLDDGSMNRLDITFNLQGVER